MTDEDDASQSENVAVATAHWRLKELRLTRIVERYVSLHENAISASALARLHCSLVTTVTATNSRQ